MTTTSIGARWEHFTPNEHRIFSTEGARGLGWIYLIDNVIYVGGLLITAVVLALHDPEATAYFAGLALVQIPAAMLAISIIRRTRRRDLAQ